MEFKLLKNLDDKKTYDAQIILVKDIKKLSKDDKEILKKVSFSNSDTYYDVYTKKLYVGCAKFKGEDLKLSFCSAIRTIKKLKLKNVKVELVQNKKELSLENLIEGMLLGQYSFKKYKSAKTKNIKIKVDILVNDSTKDFKELEKELSVSSEVCKSVNLVRDIVNTPPEDFYPASMSKAAKKIAKENSLDCIIHGEKYLRKNKMNAMLSVGRTSRHESQLIHLTYKPQNPKGKVVLVGKGLTYDSGGLSLKVGGSMVSMKCDKSGASALLGVMNSLNAINCEYEVHAILGAVENMIGGDAYKPDDVLVAKNGKTIEVRNTDAEGRLVLADCLCYAQDEIEDIDYIFDYATLTGACIVALGNQTIGTMGHSQKLVNKMQKAADSSGELIGYLPFNRYLPKMLESGIADIVNSTSSRAAGSITAGLFLDNFIKKENKKKWLHLDIAGAAYSESAWGYNSFGGTGAGVRLTLDFIKALHK